MNNVPFLAFGSELVAELWEAVKNYVGEHGVP